MPRRSAGGGGLRQLAVRGALVVGVRGVAARLVALGGTVVIARTLSAEEFGIFALGTVLLTGIGSLVQAGLGMGLVRRLARPTGTELQTVVAVNGMLMVVAVLITTAICLAIGNLAVAVALIVASTPVTAFRAPGVIVFERALAYRRLAQIEVLETLALYGLGAVLVLAGLGLSGIAVAAAVRAFGGTFLMVRASPHGVVRPRVSWRIVRDLAGFAGNYQGAAIIGFARDQGINVGITAIGGITMLGVYTVASRVLEAPRIVFQALFRVSFPAMSRLKEHGEDARNVVERTLKAVALGTGLIVAPLTAASLPLITVVFGERWSDAAAVIPPASLGLMIGGPVAVAAAGYLFAANAGRIVLRSSVLHTLAWLVIALPLLVPLGVIAAGLGSLASGLVEALVLGLAVRRRTGARIIRPLWIPLLAACGATGAGTGVIALVALDQALEASVAGIVAGGAYVMILLAVQREDLYRLRRLVRRAVRPATV